MTTSSAARPSPASPTSRPQRRKPSPARRRAGTPDAPYSRPGLFTRCCLSCRLAPREARAWRRPSPRGWSIRRSVPVKVQRALISVFNKSGLESFAKGLTDMGVQVISTGGTAKLLKDSGIPVTLVEEVTGFPEMLDGRVKTMHPKLMAGILARRDVPEHMSTIAAHDIEPIDMVVCSLYPFEEVAGRRGVEDEVVIENIDICLLYTSDAAD